MTGARQSIVGTDVPCCDFEALSCYADGELDADATAVIAEHLSGCPRCATLATRLRERFEADDAQRAGGTAGAGCWDEERLVLYAAGALDGAEHAALAAHLADCDACVAAVAVLHRHLALAPETASSVPLELNRRALRAFAGEPAESAAAAPASPPRPSWASRLARARGLLRLPVMVPAALAAGALLAVGLQSGVLQHSATSEGTRAVALPSANRRVTAVEAAVHSRPSLQSSVVGSVRRGTMVAVSGEERDWYEIRVDGGPLGWVEREAVE